MVEIRILNGLHRGATMSLDDKPHRIGAGSDCEIVLADPEIAGHHATLWPTRQAWLLTPVDGPVQGGISSRSRGAIELDLGDYARIGEIWLTVAAVNAPWVEPPALLPLPAEGTGQAEHVMAGTEAPMPDSGMVPVMSCSVSGSEPDKIPYDRLRSPFSRRIIVALVAAAAAVSVAAYAISSKSSSGANMAVAPPAVYGFDDKPLGKPSTGAAAENLSPKQLRQAFRKQLAAAGLMEQFELKLSDRAWSMRAELTNDEKSRFEHVLQGFMQEHRIAFPVHATVTNDGSMLPFQIRQVVTGANPSIVTNGGRRLHLGEKYRGVVLAAVDEDRLVFDGKRRIEVAW